MASPKFFNTTSDRRQYPRTKLAEIAYIGMGPENGGLVLDVSDGGLSFHSVAPVQTSETIRFLLSLRGHSRIEGYGEVVWTNDMRTVCGLRFTSLSSGARDHLNNWTNQSKVPATVSAKNPTDTPPQPAPSARPAEPVFLAAPQEQSLGQSPLFFWSLIAVLGVALSVAAFFYGVRVGKLRAGSVAQPAAEPVALAPPAVSSDDDSSQETASPAAPTSGPNAPALARETSLPDAQASQTGASPLPNAPGASPGASPGSAAKPDALASARLTGSQRSVADVRAQQEAGKLELAAAMAYLNGDNGQRNSSRAVQQLWAAVRNGNTEAEVILSDLYVTGDGVAKNCEQGRVLLGAAAKNGNAEAKVKLDDLNFNGCE
ncbi:MAG TPA: PilZ domain-containing protein [Candidatus Acidoferrales bacterium]|nr:PilZ domain-containing protein [Candidatus Acidoferrales bacterium]